MKALVFLDHDIICRNFVMSGALRGLPDAFNLRFIFPDDGGKRVKLDPASLNLGAPFERLKVSNTRQQTWRWVLFAQQLRFGGGEHEAAIRKLRRRTLGWKASLLLSLANLPVGSWIFRRLVDKRLTETPNLDLQGLLDREQPDIVFHPSVLESVFMNDLVVECTRRKIPLVVAMNSWDNPSTKRSVVGKPDLLLVWGPQTAEHARRFMGQPDTQVEQFGAAQFDVFLEPPRVSRADYCKALGLSPASRLILFAGSNAQTDELASLTAIDEALAEGRLRDISVIYRPHPWGGGGRGGERLAAARWKRIVIDPTMQSYIDSLGSAPGRITLPDARDTHDLVSTVDVVISPLSTILLEAMIHGKLPVAFVPEDDAGSEVMSTNVPMLHFREFLTLPDVKVARSVDELVRLLGTPSVMSSAPETGEALKKAAAWFVKRFDRPWRDRIVERLVAVAVSARDGRD